MTGKNSDSINNSSTPAPNEKDRKLRLRKILLYVVLITSFIRVYIVNVWLYSDSTRNSLYPQIRRAVVDVARRGFSSKGL